MHCTGETDVRIENEVRMKILYINAQHVIYSQISVLLERDNVTGTDRTDM